MPASIRALASSFIARSCPARSLGPWPEVSEFLGWTPRNRSNGFRGKSGRGLPHSTTLAGLPIPAFPQRRMSPPRARKREASRNAPVRWRFPDLTREPAWRAPLSVPCHAPEPAPPFPCLLVAFVAPWRDPLPLRGPPTPPARHAATTAARGNAFPFRCRPRDVPTPKRDSASLFAPQELGPRRHRSAFDGAHRNHLDGDACPPHGQGRQERAGAPPSVSASAKPLVVESAKRKRQRTAALHDPGGPANPRLPAAPDVTPARSAARSVLECASPLALSRPDPRTRAALSPPFRGVRRAVA